MSFKRKVNTAEFLQAHPVFSLDEAFKALAPSGGFRPLERPPYSLDFLPGISENESSTEGLLRAIPIALIDADNFRSATPMPGAIYLRYAR